MGIKDGYSKFSPKIWQLKSEIVKRKANEINKEIELVIKKYNGKPSENDDIKSNYDDNLSKN